MATTQKEFLRAIRLHCLDCCAGQTEEVRLCPLTDKCTLHPYRLGRDPNKSTRTLSDKQKANLDRLIKANREKSTAQSANFEDEGQGGTNVLPHPYTP